MSPRRNHPRRRSGGRPDSPLPDPGRPRWGVEVTEEWPDGEWVVRRVAGVSGPEAKRYRCPGCDQEIPPAVPHLVCWPSGDVTERRHWHVACWRARSRRAPRPLRPGRAPRH